MQQAELKQAWGEWIAGMGEWHVFGALTYDQRRRRVNRDTGIPIQPGRDVVMAHARWWLRKGECQLGRPIEAGVLALEYQKNGWPHLHPLLRLAGGLQDGDTAKLDALWSGKNGFTRLTAPRNQLAVSTYASKYLVKDLAKGDVMFWPLRGDWRRHQVGLPRELVWSA